MLMGGGLGSVFAGMPSANLVWEPRDPALFGADPLADSNLCADFRGLVAFFPVTSPWFGNFDRTCPGKLECRLDHFSHDSVRAV